MFLISVLFHKCAVQVVHIYFSCWLGPLVDNLTGQGYFSAPSFRPRAELIYFESKIMSVLGS